MDLMKLLTNDGFLRDNGLNSLQSIKKIAKLLDLPNGFTFRLEEGSISSMCQSSKCFLNRFNLRYHTDSRVPTRAPIRINFSFISDDPHLPIVYLKHTSGATHATMLKEAKIYTINNEQFIKLKNSKKEESEIMMNLNLTPNANGWALKADYGLYIKFD